MHNRIKRNFEILIKDDKYELNIYKNLYQIFLEFFQYFQNIYLKIIYTYKNSKYLLKIRKGIKFKTNN